MCFSLAWFGQILVWIIVVCAVLALLRLFVSFAAPRMGIAADVLAVVVQAIRIIIWAIVLIALVWFFVDLVSCLGPSLSLPRPR